MTPVKIRINPGVRYELRLPFSEVCMHLGIAGHLMDIELIDNDCVQLWHEDKGGGGRFSSPITASEAGLYRGSDHWYGYLPNYEEDPADLAADANRIMRNLSAILSSAPGATYTSLGVTDHETGAFTPYRQDER